MVGDRITLAIGAAVGRDGVSGRWQPTAGPLATLRTMNDRPPPNPAKLLDFWMEWERGETPPGRVMSNLKTGGLRELLESMVSGD